MQTLLAPATIPPGTLVLFPNSTSGTVASNSTLAVPDGFVAQLLDAGFTYQVNDESAMSGVISTADSKGVSSGLRASVADSKGVSDGVSVSTADSKGVSGGTAASTAGSVATSQNASQSAIISVVQSTANSG